MVAKWLACTRCGAEDDLRPEFFGCRQCNANLRPAVLEVHYDIMAAARALNRRSLTELRADIWRFLPLLPLRDPANAISLGEGGTPLVRHRGLGDAVGVRELYVKDESQNPTWSFKDRFNAVNVSVARELGFRKIASSSTGNHGTSAAAYAAAARMRCLVLLPHETPQLLRDLIQAYGAQAVVTTWHGRGPLLEALTRDHNWFPGSSFAPMPVGSPYGVEGYKTIGFELALQSRHAPLDYVFVPVGGGDGLYGIYKGWQEFLSIGMVDYLPRLVACQARGANPVVRAFEARLDEVVTVDDAYSIATSTQEETAGDRTLAAVYGTQGFALDVTDDELVDTIKLMGQWGIMPEAASALSVACARKAVAAETISENARVAALVTSTGIKWPPLLETLVEPAPMIEPRLEDLRSIVKID